MEYSRFIEPEEHYKAWLLLVAVVILLAVGVFFLSQSRIVAVLLTPAPNMEEISSAIKRDREIQDRYRDEHSNIWGASKTGIQVKLFEPTVKAKIEALIDSLLQDDQLQSELRETYGTDFRTINAIVVPGWQVMSPDNMASIGLTEVAWNGASRIAGEPSIQGFTIRDQASIPFRLTTSGIPVVTLNWAAFKSENEIKLTLFHELHHAMNINGSPHKYQLFQNDLTYLPHYRSYVDRHGLEGWTQYYIVAVTLILWALAGWLLCWGGDASPRHLLVELLGRIKRPHSPLRRFSPSEDRVKPAK